MSGDIPSGHGSVFHFLDIFTLGCVLEALAGIHKGDPLWLVGLWVAGAIGFHALGTKWALIKERLGLRLASFLRRGIIIFSALIVGYAVLFVVFYALQLRSDLDSYAMPRAVTGRQAEQIRQALMGHDPGMRIDVFASVGDPEALGYAAQLTNAIKSGGWDTNLEGVNPWETGPNANHDNGTFYNIYLALNEGVSIYVGLAGQPQNTDPQHPTPDVILSDALRKADILSNGGGAANRGKYSVAVLVGNRPRAMFTSSLKSRLGQWIMRNWIMARD